MLCHQNSQIWIDIIGAVVWYIWVRFVMRHSNHFSLFCAAILFIVGCGSDPKTLLCQPSLQTIVDGGSTTTQAYTYVGGKLTLTVTTSGGDMFQTIFVYNLDGDLGKSIQTANGDTATTSYTHSADHLLLASLLTHNGDTVRVNFLYNDNRQLVRQDKFIQDLGGSEIEEKLYYTYPDLLTHNPSSIATVNLADSVVVLYEYDNKINPEREFFLPTIQPYNNITKVSAPAFTYTVSYQYDGNGYPISSTTSTGITKTWTYFCQEF